jgi:hypothetical protein
MVPAAIAGKQLCTPIDDIFDLRTGLECKGTTVNPQLLENDTRLVLFGQAFFNEFQITLTICIPECEEQYHQRRDDLGNKKDTRIICGVIIVYHHLADVPYRVSEQNIALAIAVASKKLPRIRTHRTPRTPTVKSAIPTSYSYGLGYHPMVADV